MSATQVPAKYMQPHYSTRLWRAYFKYLARFYDKALFYEVCQDLAMPPEYLLKEDNWVSAEFTRDFVDLLKKRTGSSEIAYEVGRYIISPDVIGPLPYEFFRNMTLPAIFFLQFPRELGKANRLYRARLLKARPGLYRYELVPSELSLSSVEVCKNFCGALESVQQTFDLDSIQVTHPKCQHRGDETCLFEVRYVAHRFWRKKILSFALFGLFLTIIIFESKALMDWLQNSGPLTWVPGVFAGLLVSLGLIFRKYWRLNKFINTFHEQAHEKSAALYDSHRKLEWRYQESLTLQELSLNLVQQDDPRKVIDECVNSLVTRFQFSRCLVMLLNTQGDRLETMSARGFEKNSRLHQLQIQYGPQVKEGLFADILKQGDSKRFDDISSFREKLKAENQALIDELEIRSLCVCPLQDGDRKFGLLVVGSAGSAPILTSEDEALLSQVARSLSLYFKSARTLEMERATRTLFEKYVPAEVLKGLEGGGETPNLGAKTLELASFFIDLRSFSKITEKLSPERTLMLCNEYVEFVTERIAQAGGIIDKIVGDQVVAFFLPSPANRLNPSKPAVEAGLKILSDLPQWNKALGELGFPPARVGIGIATGHALVGNVGGKRRTNYTALGDTVNLASRLQSMTKDFEETKGGSALICTKKCFVLSESLAKGIDLGEVSIRGRETKENLMALVLEEQLEDRSSSHQSASSRQD